VGRGAGGGERKEGRKDKGWMRLEFTVKTAAVVIGAESEAVPERLLAWVLQVSWLLVGPRAQSVCLHALFCCCEPSSFSLIPLVRSSSLHPFLLFLWCTEAIT
jgi:hypothetical protein